MIDVEVFKGLITNKIRSLTQLQENKKDTIDDIDFDGDETDECQGALIANITREYYDRNAVKIAKLVRAYNKLKHNEFGICEECGEEINERRLMAALETEHCIKCAELIEKNKKSFRH